MKKIWVMALVSLLPFYAMAQVEERRCGWLDNPTPGNYFLTDKDANWTIAQQGGPSADSWEDNIPQVPGNRENAKYWKKYNGSYGYGCACLTVVSDKREEQITKIIRGKALKLSVCRKDPTLKDKEPL